MYLSVWLVMVRRGGGLKHLKAGLLQSCGHLPAGADVREAVTDLDAFLALLVGLVVRVEGVCHALSGKQGDQQGFGQIFSGTGAGNLPSGR